MSKSQPFIAHLTVGPFATNVYVFGCPTTGEGVIIDGGGDAEGLMKLASSNGLTLSRILQTHAHIDHIGAIPAIKEALDIPVWMHRGDQMLYDNAPQQGAMFGIPMGEMPPIDHWLEDGDTLAVGEFEASVIHLPGHSPGGVAFHFESADVIFSGDVLFAGSMGRVDLPGADVKAMRASLERLKGLPDATRVLSGHGPETTIGAEKAHNPYLNQDWA